MLYMPYIHTYTYKKQYKYKNYPGLKSKIEQSLHFVMSKNQNIS